MSWKTKQHRVSHHRYDIPGGRFSDCHPDHPDSEQHRIRNTAPYYCRIRRVLWHAMAFHHCHSKEDVERPQPCSQQTHKQGWNSKWNRAVGKAGPGYYETVYCHSACSRPTRRTPSRRLLPGSRHRRVVVSTSGRTNESNSISRDGNHLRMQTSSTTTRHWLRAPIAYSGATGIVK